MRIHFTPHPAKAGIDLHNKTFEDFLSYFFSMRRNFTGLGLGPGCAVKSGIKEKGVKARPEHKEDHEEIFKKVVDSFELLGVSN